MINNVSSNMFKKPQMVDGRQDTYSRKLFVIAPKECLINYLIEREPGLERFKEALYRPTVFFTPEVPYESALEGWSPAFKKIVRKAFLESYIESPSEHVPSVNLPDGVLECDEELLNQFDKWWTIREANDYSEFEEGAWKLH